MTIETKEQIREIKFRAWDKEDKEMSNDGFLDLKGEDFDYNRFELMQFTGLKDKNGKEIFEGDIVQVGEGEHITQIEIRFGVGTFDSGTYEFIGFYGVYLKVGFGGGYSKGSLCEDLDEITKNNMERFEVIGNIYENPELIEVNEIGGSKWTTYKKMILRRTGNIYLVYVVEHISL